ncbi:hypothetical protein ColTof4_07425 [Colletotrichum tofieldiae]|nr:hypothetical protein ColTof3_12374 [Colletotrichum tofieldiae]GKT75002.1 hypothetical protein ColTof4_07425 [Colletotrichum tofieldiae]
MTGAGRATVSALARPTVIAPASLLLAPVWMATSNLSPRVFTMATTPKKRNAVLAQAEFVSSPALASKRKRYACDR